MARKRRSLFSDMNASSFDNPSELTDQERQTLRMSLPRGARQAAKPKKVM